ncbi:hypothetical protein [Pseudomonas sp. P7548]|uniref:hypothetical protein n=1 Tax=Pseudomonas sp. P7548 TaxID=2726981 RepID=UPI0015B89E1E|nr:hypothetical protein [Pseudomonas sp. P7548]NWE18845.1 hypothetical protein [Pseudomonas sp. P7548]
MDLSFYLKYPESAKRIAAQLEPLNRRFQWVKHCPDLSRYNPELFDTLIHDQVVDYYRQNPQSVAPDGTETLPLIYLDEETRTGQLIKNTREKFGDIIAVFALIFLTPTPRQLIGKAPMIHDLLQDENFAYEKSMAQQIAGHAAGIQAFTEDSDNKTASERLLDLSIHAHTITRQIEELDALSKETKARTHMLDDTQKTKAIKARKLMVNRLRKFNTTLKTLKADASSSIKTAEQHLANAKELYTSQVDLSKSVEYWRKRAADHKQSKASSLKMVIGSMVLTVAIVFGYYAMGGIANMARDTGPHNVANAPAQPATPTTAAVDKALADAAKTEPTGKTIIVDTASAGGLELAKTLTNLVGAALLLALCSVLIRLALRQYNTHSHCALDANERVIFIETYLSLMLDEKLTADADRKIILESIFRATQPATGTDIPFATPVDTLIRLLDKK